MEKTMSKKMFEEKFFKIAEAVTGYSVRWNGVEAQKEFGVKLKSNVYATTYYKKKLILMKRSAITDKRLFSVLLHECGHAMMHEEFYNKYHETYKSNALKANNFWRMTTPTNEVEAESVSYMAMQCMFMESTLEASKSYIDRYWLNIKKSPRPEVIDDTVYELYLAFEGVVEELGWHEF